MVRFADETEGGIVAALLASANPPHGAAFGRFLRVADHILDDPLLAGPEKLARLETLAAIVEGRAATCQWPEVSLAAQGLRASLQATGMPVANALAIVDARRREVAGRPQLSWADLMAFCDAAAAPVGRHLLALAGEDAERSGPAADALCAAFLILQRIRNWDDPFYPFHRLCIPMDYLRDAVVSVDRLRQPPLKGQNRAVVDRVLDGVDHLLTDAAPLPTLICRTDLRRTAALALCLTRRLAHRLKTSDHCGVTLDAWDLRACRWRCWIRYGLFRR